MVISIEFALKLWMPNKASKSQLVWQNSDIVRLDIEALPQLETLLQNSALPFEDCNKHINSFAGVYANRLLIAVGGIECLEKSGLLRSLAVRAGYRGQGLAGLIVDYLHRDAIKKRIEALYLLTETAEGFFLKRGYSIISRDQLPAEVMQTKQYQLLCPASALALVCRLPVDKS